MEIDLRHFLEKNKSVVLIVDYPTGITYSNLCNGASLYKKTAEGFLIPLPRFNNTKYPIFCGSWWYINHRQGCISFDQRKDYIVETLEKALNEENIWKTKLTDFKIRDMANSYEAWIYVSFKFADNEEQMKGVITWVNSE